MQLLFKFDNFLCKYCFNAVRKEINIYNSNCVKATSIAITIVKLLFDDPIIKLPVKTVKYLHTKINKITLIFIRIVMLQNRACKCNK